MVDIKRNNFVGWNWFSKRFVKLICLDILFIFYVLALCNVSQSKSLKGAVSARKLIFDNGITFTDSTVKGKIDGKYVTLRLSNKYEIFIKSDCYGNCEGETNYKKVSLESLKKRNEEKIRIDDSVIIVLNKFGLVKRIVIVRIPE